MDTSKLSQRFRLMADKIDKNDAEDFSGAVVIVPPGDEQPIELLYLGSKHDVLYFWTQVKTAVDVAQNEYMTKEKQKQVGWR